MDLLTTWIESLPPSLSGPLSNPYIKAVLILVVFVILARLVDLGCTSILRRWTKRSRTDVDDKLLDVLHRPVFLTVSLVGAAFVVYSLELPPAFTLFLVSLIKMVILLTWALAAFPITSILIEAMTKHPTRFSAMHQRSFPLYTNLVRAFVFGMAIFTVLKIWHVDPTAWLASAGIIGIAVGFAAKDSLGNLFSGASILADAPYQIGDYINLDSGERGEVSNIGLRSTRIITRDGVEVTIPNSVIANAKIVNESRGHVRRRIRLQIGVAYGSEMDHVQSVLETVGKDHSDFETPIVRFRGFGESSLDFELLGWIRYPGDRGRIKHELYTSIYNALGREKIEIPFPKRDLYIKEMPKPLD